MSTVAKRIQREINYIENILGNLNVYVQGGKYIEADNGMAGMKKDIDTSLTSISHWIKREADKDKSNEQTE